MSLHSREHQDFVDRVLGGELAESDAAVRARLDACGECRDELARLRALDAGLRNAAREARADVERARAEVRPADEALVRRSLEAALPALGSGRGPSSRRFLLALAAGLVLLLGAGALFYLRSGREPAENLLSGGTIRCIAPLGEVDDYDEFSWSGDLPTQGSFLLSIFVLEDGKKGALLKKVSSQELRWTPSPEEKRALPDAIYWTVDARDVLEDQKGSGSAKASRSR